MIGSHVTIPEDQRVQIVRILAYIDAVSDPHPSQETLYRANWTNEHGQPVEGWFHPNDFREVN